MQPDILRDFKKKPDELDPDVDTSGLSPAAQAAISEEGLVGDEAFIAKGPETTVNIDGGSVTVPNHLLYDTFKGMGPGATDQQVLASRGIEPGDPEFNEQMGYNISQSGKAGNYGQRAALRPNLQAVSDFLQPRPAGGSTRDAMGLTRGDRKSILRSQGLKGRALSASAKLMGARHDMLAARIDPAKAGGLAPEKRGALIGEVEALGGDPNVARQLDDEQLLAALTREKTQRQIVQQNEKREMNQATTRGKLEAYGMTPDQLQGMSPAEMQGTLVRMETQAALRPEETPKLEPVDVDGDGAPDFLRLGNTLRDMPRGETPTTRQRDSGALQTALEAGDWARAALLIGTVEKPGALGRPNIRVRATAEDAQALAQNLSFDQPAEVEPAPTEGQEAQIELTPVQERGIERVMEANKLSREEAINALREAGRL